MRSHVNSDGPLLHDDGEGTIGGVCGGKVMRVEGKDRRGKELLLVSSEV